MYGVDKPSIECTARPIGMFTHSIIVIVIIIIVFVFFFFFKQRPPIQYYCIDYVFTHLISAMDIIVFYHVTCRIVHFSFRIILYCFIRIFFFTACIYPRNTHLPPLLYLFDQFFLHIRACFFLSLYFIKTLYYNICM